MEKRPCVYILASKKNGALYTSVTSNPAKRVWEHRNGLAEGFTRQYGVHILVWLEVHATMESAISREKAIKRWRRRWKIDLIERTNPEWKDLSDNLIG